MSGPLGASYWKKVAGRGAKGIGGAWHGTLICPNDDAALDYHPEENTFTCPACARTYAHADGFLTIRPANDPYRLDDAAIARLSALAPDRVPATTNPVLLNRIDEIMGEVKEKRVLDVCCGQGWGAAHFEGRGAFVAAVDIVTGEGGLASVPDSTEGSIDRFQADVCRLPFADDTFDAVFASDCLHGLARPERLMREVARLLKSNGVFASANEPVGRGSLSLGEDPRADGRQLSLRDYAAIFSEVGFTFQAEKEYPLFIGRHKPEFKLPKFRLPWRKKK